MKNGIGPQSLGASGLSPNSKPCGTPLDFNDKLRQKAKAGELNPGFTEAIETNDPALNSGSPFYSAADTSKIQEAASTLEAHNIGGGGGEVQGTAAAAQESAAANLGTAPVGRGRFKSFSGLSSFMKRRRLM